MADNGIKISREGYSVKTIPNSATNIKKFVLLSGVNLLKIKTAAKVTIADNGTQTIAHGLAYTPIAWVFMNSSGNMYPIYYQWGSTRCYVDGTNLSITNVTGSSKDFYYYIFYDPI